MKKKKQIETNTCDKNDRTKRGSKSQSGTLPKGATNTIRSKIESKLTEEKLKDRENAAHPNTPWAPSGSERIKVPAARFLCGPVGTVGCEGQGAWYCLRMLC